MPLDLIAMTMLTWQLIYVKCLSITRHFLPGLPHEAGRLEPIGFSQLIRTPGSAVPGTAGAPRLAGSVASATNPAGRRALARSRGRRPGWVETAFAELSHSGAGTPMMEAAP